MNKNKAVIIGVVILILIGVGIVFSYKNKNGVNRGAVSQNILYLTQPINSFSGTVDKIEGNVIFVSHKYNTPQTAPLTITVMPGQTAVMPTPQVETITYQVAVTGKTQFSQPPLNVVYLFNKTNTLPSQPTIKDVRVGSYISITSMTDLRVMEGNIFEASSIILPPLLNTLNGKVVRTEGNTITLKAFPPTAMGIYDSPAFMSGIAPTPPQEKEYTITISSSTEISRYVYSNPATINPAAMMTGPNPEKVAQSDLKKDMQIMVYTDFDVTEGTNFIALRIEPVIPSSAVAPVAAPSASEPAQIITPNP